MTKVYAVAAYDNYYPSPDNVIAMFFDEEEALKCLEDSIGGPMDYYDLFVYDVYDKVDKVND